MAGKQFQENLEKKTYLSIVAGLIVHKVPEGTEGSRRREYTSKDGLQVVKNEIAYSYWEGTILDVSIKDSPFGEQCVVRFDDAELSFPVKGRYFQSFAVRIFNANLLLPIRLHPYDFESDNKKIAGISVQQNGEKLKDYFYDYDIKMKINGFPEADEEKAEKNKSYWTIYFLEVADFLKERLGLLFSTTPVPELKNEEIPVSQVAGATAGSKENFDNFLEEKVPEAVPVIKEEKEVDISDLPY